MIGKLKGVVDAVGENHAVIDVNGVGYEVQCSSRTLRSMELGQKVGLVIDTHVREDAIRLYGFTSEVERTWFRTLQGIQGVGAKVALAVLGTLSTGDLASAIALANWQAVEQAPGVGRKLAQRIVTELKDKAPALSLSGSGAGEAGGMVGDLGGGIAPPTGEPAAEAVSALVNLGYQPSQAMRAVAAAGRELGAAAETAALIRRGLKELAR
jgi:Holliday junction DNA helicase RuvA